MSVQKIKDLKEKGNVNDEGYINVASELGLSRSRGKTLLAPMNALDLIDQDTSTYHDVWVSQQRRQGYMF